MLTSILTALGLTLTLTAGPFSADHADILGRTLAAVPRVLYATLSDIETTTGPTHTLGSMFLQIFTDSTWFTFAVRYELGQAEKQTAYRDRPWIGQWAKDLADEAGCDPRELVVPIYFPGGCGYTWKHGEFWPALNEFWMRNAHGMWSQALDQWERGYHHPIDQALLAAVWYGHDGAILAYRDGTPELWQAYPWRCGGPVTIIGPTFTVGLTLDDTCRVTAITMREGL